MAHRDGAVLSFGDKDLVAVAIGRYQNAIFRRLKWHEAPFGSAGASKAFRLDVTSNQMRECGVAALVGA